MTNATSNCTKMNNCENKNHNTKNNKNIYVECVDGIYITKPTEGQPQNTQMNVNHDNNVNNHDNYIVAQATKMNQNTFSRRIKNQLHT